GIAGVRHAVGEASLVRRGPPGWPGAAQRVLAGAERGFTAGRGHPAGSAGHHGEPRGGVRGRRRGLPATAQDATRRAVRLGRLGSGGPTAAPRGAPRLAPGARGESLAVAEFARLAAARHSPSPAAPRTISPS